MEVVLERMHVSLSNMTLDFLHHASMVNEKLCDLEARVTFAYKLHRKPKKNLRTLVIYSRQCTKCPCRKFGP